MPSYDQKIAELESTIRRMERDAIEMEIRHTEMEVKMAEMEAKIEQLMDSYELLSRILKRLKLLIRQPKEGMKWFLKFLFWRLKSYGMALPRLFEPSSDKATLSPEGSRIYKVLNQTINKKGKSSENSH